MRCSFQSCALTFWCNAVQWEIALQKGQGRANSLRTMLRPLCTPYTKFRHFCVACVFSPITLGICCSSHCLACFLSGGLHPLLHSFLRSSRRVELTMPMGTTKPSCVIDNRYDDPLLANTRTFFVLDLDFPPKAHLTFLCFLADHNFAPKMTILMILFSRLMLKAFVSNYVFL